MSDATVEITVDGEVVTVGAGATILDALRHHGVETPTICSTIPPPTKTNPRISVPQEAAEVRKISHPRLGSLCHGGHRVGRDGD